MTLCNMNLHEFRQKYNYNVATKMMQQYLDIKFAHLDCLLLFRMGDFYELFYEDAILASNILGIALTKRGKNCEEEIPMCGVPYHALEHYLTKLIEENYKVAICDQLETPEEAKKRDGYKAVVTRDVTRIITPGTIIEENLISVTEPNYLTSLVIPKNKKTASICCVDLSTSKIFVINVPETEILNELARLKSREILLSENLKSSNISDSILKQFNCRITYQVDSFFAINKCEKIILDFYKIRDIKGIGEISNSQICAIGSILEYLSLTQKQNIPHLPIPKIINFHNYMTIDFSTRRNLEIVTNLQGNLYGSVLNTLNHTVTTQGGRLLYHFLSSPLTNIAKINHRLNITEFFYSNLGIVTRIRELLKNTSDIERCLTRITMNRSSGRDLLSIKYTLETAKTIKGLFSESYGLNLPHFIEKIIKPLSGDAELYNLIHMSIREDAPNNLNDGGIIKYEFHPKIAQLNDLINNKKLHVEKLKDQYRKETRIESLKISHNNVLGFFIDITPKNVNKILDPKFIHRQTTINSVRYTTYELQNLENELVNAQTLVIRLEKELYTDICRKVIEKSSYLKILANSLSGLDVFCNFAYIADEYDYTKPEFTNDLSFDIVKGRHPVVEAALRKTSKSFVYNDCHLSEAERIWLITGPNMAGKSTYLRQNAIITIIAQIGSFVPAKSAKIGVVDKIFSRIGAADDLIKGQSTFMAEMLETSAILAQSTKNSLIILDEVGRGTSTYDGVSIAWSVLEYIHDKLQCRCLFATHYHELTVMKNFLPALQNYTIAIEESGKDILFLHNIILGASNKSYGLHVAALAGLPTSVINRAAQILLKFEKISISKEKNILSNASNNLSLFNFEHEKPISNSKLDEEFKTIDPDKISPKEALELIYKFKKLV
ncbi:DNA MISMATCH REPAIR PROTEIN MUTS (mutS) [Rickettsia prowazekii str. Madrid E]|uniref:DNA mismatch repair protein MutS n=2 Tax=Rickettsia prowazekii TaxID=782 RepID=MUTS_RICPR|nr:RecName: Full=DNA mismatch repair protein MutS [Rickettsia prowazekii str. Madrid E]CAA14759.1 DNA MISMATCH REPAIR PROTEIN MUTS (mutS) [Rickettsia prowazekii str. Madrid E]